jgi:hypothetical protein
MTVSTIDQYCNEENRILIGPGIREWHRDIAGESHAKIPFERVLTKFDMLRDRENSVNDCYPKPRRISMLPKAHPDRHGSLRWIKIERGLKLLLSIKSTTGGRPAAYVSKVK